MSQTVNPIPAGYQTVTPYLCAADAAAAIAFYQKAFGATEVMQMVGPDGKVAHAEFDIGDVRLMISDEYPEIGVKSPQTLGGSAVSLNLFVADVDVTFKLAIAVGATELRPVENKFHGERSGQLLDPFGHRWIISTRFEDVSSEEMQRRFDEMMKG